MLMALNLKQSDKYKASNKMVWNAVFAGSSAEVLENRDYKKEKQGNVAVCYQLVAEQCKIVFGHQTGSQLQKRHVEYEQIVEVSNETMGI
jgi:hypothetical protein